MILSEEIKNKITIEYNNFKDKMYVNKSLEERQKLDQFYTPPSITIQMIESFNCDSLSNKTILDPTCGSGNLLAACIIAGADVDKVYGNEYDNDMVKICRKRLKELCESLNKEGFKYWQIHRGNALQKKCLTEFSDYYQTHYNEKYIDDLNYAQNNYNDDFQKLKSQQENMSEADLW